MSDKNAPAPPAEERCFECHHSYASHEWKEGRCRNGNCDCPEYERGPAMFRTTPSHRELAAYAPAPLADGGKTVFDGYPLSRAEYVERIHEGGRGGYGIATHDVLMHHDAALRAALDKAKEALMKIRDGIDGEYIATQRGVAIAARALAELEGK